MSNPTAETRLETRNPWATPTRTVLVAVPVPVDMMIEDGYGNPYLVDTCGDLARDTIVAHLGGFTKVSEIRSIEAVALLPCPFCGVIPTVEKWHGGGPKKRMVHCESEFCAVTPSVTGSTRASAVEKWNRRAPA